MRSQRRRLTCRLGLPASININMNWLVTRCLILNQIIFYGQATAMPTAGRHWAELPDELLGLILQKLTVQDCLRFSCVCAQWNLTARVGGGELGLCRPEPKPQLPWLMLPAAGQDDTSAKFISTSEHRTYNIPLPRPPIRERLCVGSSHGWLITLYNFSEMHLLNPITGVQVPLPSITTTIPAATALFFPPGYRRSQPAFSSAFYGKAILSSAPSRDGTGDFTVFLLHNLPLIPRTLAITRIGDDTWTTLTSEYLTDIIYHKCQLLCVDVAGSIHILEQQQQQHHLSFVPKTTINTGFFCHNNTPLHLTYAEGKHLAESTTGELFMLLRTHDADGTYSTARATRFEIIRLDMERKEYVTVIDLEDTAFFVGVNDSIIVSAAEFPEVKPNCVYFTENYFFRRRAWQLGMKTMAACPRNIGVFDVEKEKVAELLDIIGSGLSRREEEHIGSLLKWPPPTWVIPTLF